MIVIIRCEECAVCPMPDSTGQPPSSRQITLIIARRAGLLGKNCDICLSDCEEDIDRRYQERYQVRYRHRYNRSAHGYLGPGTFLCPRFKNYNLHSTTFLNSAPDIFKAPRQNLQYTLMTYTIWHHINYITIYPIHFLLSNNDYFIIVWKGKTEWFVFCCVRC